jgi:hypothetical protein
MQKLPEFQFDIDSQETMMRVRKEMIQSPFRFDFDNEPTAGKDAIWVSILTLSSIAFSYVFVCATPFAALGALAGTRMRLGAGLAVTLAAWAANQFVGFFILSYPRTWDSFGWGAAIGAAALLGALAARWVSALPRNALASTLIAFATAFVVYEAALFAATAFLPSCAGAFSLPVVGRIFLVNLGAFVGLLFIQRLAVWFGLQEEPHLLRPVLNT